MKIAVDVCMGARGVRCLRAAGHEVLEAEHGERDRDWFARARAWGVELIVSPDSDLEILAYDNRVRFFRVRCARKFRGRDIAEAVIAMLARSG